jgi:SAM-dependent methyltransferase
MNGDRWAEIWARRAAKTTGATGDQLLTELLRADGFDTAYGVIDVDVWRTFAASVATGLDLHAGQSVFEVGCGAGAFLLPFAAAGHPVGGIDRAAALVDGAQAAIPDGDFAIAEAAEFPVLPRYDAVVSCGVFFYFPDLAYAERVIAAMAAKAVQGIALLDLPDVAKRDAALAERRAAFGSPAEYEARYAGLEHLYFDRGWVVDRLAEHGFDSRVAQQDIAGYANGAFRFNVLARRRP